MGFMSGLMIAIYSRNMLLVYTQIKFCLDCEVMSLLFSLYMCIIKTQRGCLF